MGRLSQVESHPGDF